MPYYAGDYTLGDPGLFSFVKKAVGAVGKVVGSPVGSLALGLIPGGGFIKTGLGVLGGLAGGGKATGAGVAAGGTPGAVAHVAEAVRTRIRGARRRVRAARRRRR